MLSLDEAGKIYLTTDLGTEFIRAYEDFKRVERNYHNSRGVLSGILSSAGLRS